MSTPETPLPEMPVPQVPAADANSLGVTPDSPWLGLRSFTEAVRGYFYGRDAEIQELFERVQHRTLTVLFGQSGLGKTSLLRAGLIPQLRAANYVPILIRLVHEESAQPLEQQVVQAIATHIPAVAAAVQLPVPEWDGRMTLFAAPPEPTQVTPPAPSLWELFHDPAVGLTSAGLRPVLIIDQFEELFTLGEAKRPDDARAFLDALACLVENRPPAALRVRMDQDDDLADRLLLGPQPCKVLLTLRDDFLHRLERGRRQMPSMMDNRLELRLLSGPQAYRAVYEPGTKRPEGPIVQPETARDVVRFVAGAKPGTPLEEIDNVPPLLSLICEQLNSRRLSRNEPTIHAESLAQSAPEVLRDFYESAFAAHPPAVRHFVEDELVSASGFRESKTLDSATADLIAAGVPSPTQALRNLVDQRLLVIEDRGGVARLELTHDILAPIAAAARKERAEREAQAESQRRLERERRNRHTLMGIAGVMGVLLIGTLVSGLLAWTKAAEARLRVEEARLKAEEAAKSARQAELAVERADSEAKRATAANAENVALLRRASMADHAYAMKAWQEFDDALRQGMVPRKTGVPEKLYVAVAHWVRALELDPSNRLASQWLFDSLRRRGHVEGIAKPTILSHDQGVTSANFNRDGTRVVTSSWDRSARIWDVHRGTLICEPLRHDDSVFSACFSPDGTRVVTASYDNTARLWDAKLGKQIGSSLEHDGPVNHACFSPDGRLIATASLDCTARIWDAGSGERIGEPLRHGKGVWFVSFSADSAKIITTSDDATAQIWKAIGGEPVGAPLRHRAFVGSACFSPDGLRIATASFDHTGQIWNAETGLPVGAPLQHSGHVKSVRFSPDGAQVVTASADNTARVWDAVTGTAIGEPLRHEKIVWSAHFSSDGTRLITASADGTARLWDANRSTPIGIALQHGNAVTSALFSEDGTKGLTASEDHYARIWDVASDTPRGEPVRGHQPERLYGTSRNGARVVSVRADNSALIFDTNSGAPLGKPIRHDATITCASFSDDGALIITGSNDHTARIWIAETGTPTGPPLRHDDAVISVRLSNDGTRAATASSDKTARIWDSVTGRPIGKPLRHEREVRCVYFSPDGSLIVTASGDKTARIWDATNGEPLGEPLSHEDSVSSARFSHDGRRIVTCSEDRTARIFDALSGKLNCASLRHNEFIYRAAYSADDERIVTTSDNNLTRVWEVAGQSELEAIRDITPAVLSWASAWGGMRLRENGDMEPIPQHERNKLAASKLPKGPWKDLDDWLGTSGPHRQAGLRSTLTVRQIAERERDYESVESLESAIQIDPTVPLARSILANSKEKERNASMLRIGSNLRSLPDFAVVSRAALWRRYDLDRLPEDADLWDRAAEILRELPDSQVGIGPKAIKASEAADQAERRAAEIRAKQAKAGTK